MNHTRAAAAVHGLGTAVTEEGNRRAAFKGEGVFILQKHKGIGRRLSGQLGVGGIVHPFFLFTLGGTGLGDHRKDVDATGIQRLHADGTAVNSVHQNGRIIGIAGHIEVVHGVDLMINAARHAAPVAGDHTGKAELIPQDVHQKLSLGGIVVAVDAVVGGHDRPGGAIPHHDTEALEVDLPEGALGDIGGVDHARGLLIVHGEMLDLGTDARGLQAVHISRHKVAREKRILRAVLEITTAENILLNIHTGSQQNIRTECSTVQADSLAHAVDQVRIPRGGDIGHRRIPHGGSVHVGAYTRRAVVEADGGNAILA